MKLRRLYFLQASVCPQGGRVGVSASVHAGIPPPQEQTPPGSRHPPEQTPSRSRHPPGADTSPRDTVTAADGTHPTGMHSCAF